MHQASNINLRSVNNDLKNTETELLKGVDGC